MLHNLYYIVKPHMLQQTVTVGANAVIALDIEAADRRK